MTMITSSIKNLIASSAIATSLLLSACSDADNVLATGGGAGDSAQTNEDIALLKLYTGIYNLQDNWKGISGDRAFLVIRDPDATAKSEAVLIDVDDLDNCIPERKSIGSVRRNAFTGDVFMDGILLFDEARLSLTGTTLNIEFNDPGGSQRVSVTAQPVAIMENDLGDPC